MIYFLFQYTIQFSMEYHFVLPFPILYYAALSFYINHQSGLCNKNPLILSIVYKPSETYLKVQCFILILERETGIEPATLSLGS